MFGNLPATEKQAFFSLLDEYFTARPHLLPTQSEATVEETSSRYASPPAPAPRRSNPPTPAARKPAAPAISPRTGPAAPSDLTSGKSFGGIKTSTAGAALGSILANKQKNPDPITAGQALTGIQSAAARMNLGARSTAPPPPPPIPAPVAATSSLGQAEVLYDYNGTEEEDLNVRKFDIVELVEKINDDWWKAQSTDGRTGMVPSAYVQVL